MSSSRSQPGSPKRTGPGDPNSRITVVRAKDRFVFLVDGRGGPAFDKSFGVSSYPTYELAQKAGEFYVKQLSQANAFAAELMGAGTLKRGK